MGLTPPKPPPAAPIVAQAGGPAKVAKALGIRITAVIKWRQVPANRAPEVAVMAGMTTRDVRPDVYRPHMLPLAVTREIAREKKRRARDEVRIGREVMRRLAAS